jgi:hypothetical protein
MHETLRTWMKLCEDELSPSFYKWFRDSKVVDEHGRPLPVYHGGPKGIQRFGDNYAETLEWAARTGYNLSAIERQIYSNPLHFFTDDEYVADDYADQHDNPQVYEVYLRIEKPLDLRPSVAGRDAVAKVLGELLTCGVDFEDAHDRDVNLRISHRIRSTHTHLKSSVTAMGYDGVIMPDTCVRDRSLHTSYVVFSPNQIKLVQNKRFTNSPFINR